MSSKCMERRGFMKYKITDGSISLGGKTILSHFDFEIKGREKLALVGPNGCGKTTLLRLIAGELSMDRDDKRKLPVINKSSDFTIAILNQHVFSSDEELDRTVEELLLEACPCKDRFDRERFLYEKEYDNLFTCFGFSKADKKRKLATFSGGQKTRIALIRLLLEKPDLLLLDEPTNHLDEEMTEWLEAWIRSYDKAVLMVSHDRYFLDETADGIYEVVDQKLFRYSGNYSAYVSEKQKKREILLKAWEREQEEIKRLEDLIKKFKNKPKKAAFARSRQKILDRMEHLEKPSDGELRPFKEEIIPAVRSSKYVLEAEELGIGYDHEILQLSLRIRRGQKIGVIGKNGIGKSTFLKTAAGLLSPVRGRCLAGINVTQAYFDQNSAEFQSDLTVIDHFKGKFPSMTDKDARAILGRWMFGGREAMKKISDLSGGERSRLYFAELFMECPNFLIVDEPTNHMDIKSKDILKQALKAFDGTLIVVSHDRDFLDGLVDKIYEFKDGRVREHLGGVAEFLSARRLENLQELERSAAQATVQAAKPAETQQKMSYAESREKTKEDRRKKSRISFLEHEIEKQEARMKAIEKILEAPGEGDDIMELTREYLECKRDLDAKTDEWGSLID